MKKHLMLAGMIGLLLAGEALANVGGGSTRVPLTDFLIEVYNTVVNVYVPLLAVGALFTAVLNMATGVMRFGRGVSMILLVVGLLGLGVTWVAGLFGGTMAIALVA